MMGLFITSDGFTLSKNEYGGVEVKHHQEVEHDTLTIYIDRKVKCKKHLRDGKSWETAYKSIKEMVKGEGL